MIKRLKYRMIYILAIAFSFFGYYKYWGIDKLVPFEPIDFIYVFGVLLIGEYLHNKYIE